MRKKKLVKCPTCGREDLLRRPSALFGMLKIGGQEKVCWDVYCPDCGYLRTEKEID